MKFSSVTYHNEFFLQTKFQKKWMCSIAIIYKSGKNLAQVWKICSCVWGNYGKPSPSVLKKLATLKYHNDLFPQTKFQNNRMCKIAIISKCGKNLSQVWKICSCLWGNCVPEKISYKTALFPNQTNVW